MNPLDLGVIAIIVLSAVFAFARGFVREALSIVAWVGAAAITLYGFKWAFALIEPHAHNPLLSQVVAGFGLFVISLVILTILTGVVARMVHFSGLTPIDRTLGFLFGLARGAFLVCLAYLLLDLTVPQPDQRPEWIRDAKTAPYLHEGASILQSYLPESLKTKSADAAGEFMRTDPAAAELAKSARGALLNPASPSTQPPQPTAPDYKTDSRREMNRLIENNAREP